MVEPSQKSPPAAGDPVTTVMSKLPADKGDVGTFLVSYGIGYIAVDVLAAGMGLPPPITTAALTSGVVVGVKNVIQAARAKSQQAAQAAFAESHSSQLKEDLERRTRGFRELLVWNDKGETSAASAIFRCPNFSLACWITSRIRSWSLGAVPYSVCASRSGPR
jgi:hypothetical protein